MKKPIIAINGRFLTQSVTGIQRYATEMTLALGRVSSNYQLIIFAPTGKLSRQLPNLWQDNFPLTGHPWEQLRLPWLARKLHADLLWCPTNTAPLLSLTPMVATIHDAAVFANPKWFSATYGHLHRLIQPLAGRVAQRVITCSHFSYHETLRYGIVKNKRKLRVIFEGVTEQLQKNCMARRQGPFFYGKKYVLTLSSRDPRKNIKRLIEAWESIPFRIKKDRVLAVAGKSNKLFSEEGFAKVPDDVVLMGYVPDDQLTDLYGKAELFVFPSLYEGFGLPPLEAMACGAPVLVSHTASLPEVCGDAAMYCDPYDVEDIASKLSLLLSEESLRKELIQKGLARASLFTWEKAAKELVNVFGEIINKNAY